MVASCSRSLSNVCRSLWKSRPSSSTISRSASSQLVERQELGSSGFVDGPGQRLGAHARCAVKKRPGGAGGVDALLGGHVAAQHGAAAMLGRDVSVLSGGDLGDLSPYGAVFPHIT
jgi:hypothetical protein